MANLEQRLGELSGELRALVPALERVEERVTTDQKEIASLRTEIDNIRNEIEEIKRLQREENENKREDEKGDKNHIWDFIKLIVAASVGAVLTYIFEKMTK
jgi:predicted  nucleic acid-binding Zn-ribbon protein